jgi:HAD superfamily hydrolase (TIGR01549 family)
VLFDIGGPIDTEILFERKCDRLIGEAFATYGCPVPAEMVSTASNIAVAERAPNAYIAMIEQLAGGNRDLTLRVLDRFRSDIAALDLLQIRDGIEEVLRWLVDRGLKLGVVANQPQRKIAALRRAGLAEYFTDLQMSEGIGLRKPGLAIFQHVCATLGVEPERCVMWAIVSTTTSRLQIGWA